MAFSLRGLIDAAVDLVDPNTKDDEKRRLQQGKSKQYIRGEIAQTPGQRPAPKAQTEQRATQVRQLQAESRANPERAKVNRASIAAILSGNNVDLNTNAENKLYQPSKSRSTFQQIVEPFTGTILKGAADVPANLASLFGAYGESATNLSRKSFNAIAPEALEVSEDNRIFESIGDAYRNMQKFGANQAAQNALVTSEPIAARDGENKLVTGLSGGAGSLATSVALAAGGGGAALPSVLFGSQAAGDQFRGAKEAGLSTEKALGTGLIAGGTEAALEKVGLDRFTAGGGGLVTNLIKKGISEGSQESAQQFAGNVITNSYDKTQGLTDGVAESGLYGTLLGSGGSFAMDSGRNPSVQKVGNQVIETTTSLVSTKPILTNEEIRVLSDFQDYKMGNLTDTKVINQILPAVQSIAEAQGVSLSSGNVSQLMDDVNKLISGSELRQRAQGGYINVSGRSGEGFDGLSSDQKQFINEYAESLEGMDGSGVSIMPDGTRQSANSPFYRETYAEKGRAPTKAEWFEEARYQLENGKDAFGASEEYAQLSRQPVNPITRPGDMAKYKNFDTFYADHGQFMADQGFNKDQAKLIYDTAVNQPITVSADSTRTLKQDQAQIEQAKSITDQERLDLARGDTGTAGLLGAEAGTRRYNAETGKIETIAPETTDGRTKTRKFGKTVKASPEVSGELKKAFKPSKYQQVSNDTQSKNSQARIVQEGLEGTTTGVKSELDAKLGTINDQTVSDSIATIKALDERASEADLQNATEIIGKLEAHLTKAGQTIQAASLLNNRTPQGLLYGAQKALKNSGVEVTPEIQSKLNELVNNVKNAKGEYQDGLARHQLTEYVAKKVPSSNAGKVVQIWKAGLLTSPLTTAGNLAANTAERIFSTGYVNPIAAGVDTLFSAFTGKRSTSFTLRGIGEGTVEGSFKGISYFKNGYDPRNPTQKFDVRNIHYSDSPAGRAAEVYTQSVFRLMGSQDQPFYYAALRNSLADQAVTEAKNRGLSGAERSDFIKKYVSQPDKDVMQLADKEAKYAVFQDDTALGGLASGIKKKSGALGDFVMPFTGVPSSLATRIFTRTPIGVANEIIKQTQAGKFDQRAMSKAIANGSSGIILSAAGAALVSAGRMTLDYPEDPKERELWELEGKQSYSIKVGGSWLSLNYFQPAGTLMAVGAQYQAAKDAGESDSTAISQAAAAGGKAFTEQSFLKGISGVLNAVTDPSRSAETFLKSTAGSVIPNFIRTAARTTDDVNRETNNPVDAVMGGIPGLRQNLNPRRDVFGEPVPRKTSSLSTVFNPFRPSDSRGDETVDELRRLQDLGEGTVPTSITKNALGSAETLSGEKAQLTNDQIDELEQIVGPEIKDTYEEVMRDVRYGRISDESKKKVLDRVESTVYGARKKEYGVQENIILTSDKLLDSREQKLILNEDIDWFEGIGGVDKFGGLDKVLSDPNVDGQTFDSSDRSLVRNSYLEQFDKKTSDFYYVAGGDAKMGEMIEAGEVSRETLDEAIRIDNLLTEKGFQKYPQIGKRLRSKYGYAYTSSQNTTSSSYSSSSGSSSRSYSSGSSRSSSRSSGSSSSKKTASKGKFDLTKLFGTGISPTTNNKALQAILNKAIS